MRRHSGLRLLMKQALRQAIWETLNRHRTEGEPDIALIGSRRSGSTLLMQVIGHHPGVKSVDQPFALYTATSAQMRVLGYPPGGMFIAPSASDIARITHYVSAMQAGHLNVQEPWRFWRRDFHFRSDRLVLKTTNASYLSSLFADMGLINVLYFRHPVPQSLSCARNNWGDQLDFFARHGPFVERFLNSAQRNLLDNIATRGAELERYVLGWCFENKPLFEANALGTPTVFYEDLVNDPEGTLRMLEQVCAIRVTPAMRKMVGEASVSVRNLSDAAAAAAIRSGDKDALIGRWRSKVSAADLCRVQDILDHFPGCVYRADTILPLRREATQSERATTSLITE